MHAVKLIFNLFEMKINHCSEIYKALLCTGPFHRNTKTGSVINKTLEIEILKYYQADLSSFTL